MNPEIDVGQVEGAFIMGLGYWLTEQAIYDPTTGLQLNSGTWVCHRAIIDTNLEWQLAPTSEHSMQEAEDLD